MVGIGSFVSPYIFFATTSNNSVNNNYNIQQKDMSAGYSTTDNDVIRKLRDIGLEKKELPYHKDLRRASVLVPLFRRTSSNADGSNISDASTSTQTTSNIHVLFTQRPQRMKSHGGEVCFPGGKQDEEDEGCDIRTALRETHEEVGLHYEYIESIARMGTLESRNSLCVTPIIGIIEPASVVEPSQLKLNREEVEAAFAVPLTYFADEDNLHSIEEVVYTRTGGKFIMRTYLYDDPDSGRQFKIWGLTAHIIYLIAKHAYL